MSTTESNNPERQFLNLATSNGAVITGKPDGSEAVSVVFTPAAWQAFSAAARRAVGEPVAWAATSDEGKVEALGFNQSRRFDTPLCFAAYPATVQAEQDIQVATLTRAIQSIKGSIYNLTKDECIFILENLREDIRAARASEGAQG